MTARPPFLIVGGGIGGLAAALALARVGRDSIVLEQAPEFAEIGAGIQLGPNVFRMFERLGLTQSISKLAVFPDYLMMRDSVTGEEVTRIDLGEPFLQRFGYPYAVIHRADLHRRLLEACRDTGIVQLETSRKVSAMTESADRVIARTDDGAEFQGAALIGADGLWSSTRQRIVEDGNPIVSGHIAYRAVLPTTEIPERLRWHAMVLWAGEKVHLVQYPMRGGELFNLVAVFHSDRYTEGWDAQGDASELYARFAGKHRDVLLLLEKIESWRMWVLCDREPVRNWSKGRVTLLGDSAHPMLQYLAQGANMAIEDAVCLADRIKALPDDPATAFAQYQAARYLRTARVQLTARLYGEAYHASGVTRELRNTVLGSRNQSQAYESMAWLYEPADADLHGQASGGSAAAKPAVSAQA